MNDVFEKIDLNSVDWKSSREFFESLGEALDRLEDKDESYNFTWVGKRKSIIEAGAPINKILRPDMEASKDFDNTKNMLIVGDNLDALKLLQESYLGKIKMIYIDPPYNTGHDFVYHDNFTIKKADFEDGSTDSEGNVVVSEDEFAENSKANGRFHSDWLSMMYPRLKLARNLLTDDGVIFISIDDNEQANLKKLCDEVFGEDNFIAEMPRKTTEHIRVTADYSLQSLNDYILAYAKNISEVIFNKRISGKKEYKYSDEIGEYMLKPFQNSGENGTRRARPNLYYPIYFNNEIKKLSLDRISPSDDEIFPRQVNGEDGRWLWSREKFSTDNKLLEYRNGTLYRKVYQSEDDDFNKYEPEKTWLDSYQNRLGAKALSSLGLNGYFDYSKPVELIQFLLKIASHRDSLVLDFFAGSGTTAQALMRINNEDNGNRKFILCQLPEQIPDNFFTEETSCKTIDAVTIERIKRSADFEYLDPKKHDAGFRVFRVDSNNENENVRKSLSKTNQSDIFSAIDNIKEDRTPLDLLFGVIYASALPFDLKLETRKIGENIVYLYGYLDEGTGLVACFDDNISEETFKEIAKLKALTAAFKDSSFTNSAAKINLSEHFRIICPDTKVKVI